MLQPPTNTYAIAITMVVFIQGAVLITKHRISKLFSKNCDREFSLPLHNVLLFLFLIFKNVPGFAIEHLTDRR